MARGQGRIVIDDEPLGLREGRVMRRQRGRRGWIGAGDIGGGGGERGEAGLVLQILGERRGGGGTGTGNVSGNRQLFLHCLARLRYAPCFTSNIR
jgi:hypothetical protein